MDKLTLLLLAGIGYLFYSSRQTQSADLSRAVQTDIAGLEKDIFVDLQSGEVKTKAEIAAVGFATGTAASVAGAAGTASAGGTFLALSATSWTIVGAAIVGAIAIIASLRSVTHLYANQLVDNYENPFGDALSGIIDPIDRTDRRQLEDAKGAVIALWTQYQMVMQEFINRGGDWRIVAEQSLRNLNSREGMGGMFPEGFINRLINDLDADIARAAA